MAGDDQKPNNNSERVIEAFLAFEGIGWCTPGYALDAGAFFLENRVEQIFLALGVPQCRVVFYDQIAHWRLRKAGNIFNYLFGDLRSMDLKDNLFDRAICISTLEHIGMDNSRYGAAKEDAPESWLDAVREIHRTLKPGARLLATVPYGKAEQRGWFQVFSTEQLNAMANLCPWEAVRMIVYRKTDNKWGAYDVGLNADPAVDDEGNVTQFAALWLVKAAS